MVSQLLISIALLTTSVLSWSESRRPHKNPAVGEVEPFKRLKASRSNREPAILNLNDELERLTELNSPLEESVGASQEAPLIQGETKAEASKEFFFNKFLVVDEKILLFGEKLTGVLNCKGSGGGNLVLSDSRQINTKTLRMPPGSRSLGFKDGKLCESAIAVFKSDPQGESRLIVVEATSEKVTRFDIR